MKVNIVIPAAGLATRLRPLTSNISKAMVRVNGKPAIGYILDHLYEYYDIEEVVIVDGKFDDIREFIKYNYPDESIVFVKQKELNGPRDAIMLGLDELFNKNIPVVVWLGDTLVFDKDLPFGDNFLLTKYVEDQSSWCVWDGNKKYFDKPSFNYDNYYALVGVYGFNNSRNALNAFCDNSYEISSVLTKFGNSFKNINVKEWHDIGDLSNYYKTCGALLNRKARDFNKFQYDPELNVLIKTPNYSSNTHIEKIKNEQNWYNKLTPTQKLFTPKIVDDSTKLIMSYESGSLISDLFYYELLSENAIEHIIDKIFQVMLKNFHIPEDNPILINMFPDNVNSHWIQKSRERLSTNYIQSKIITDHFDYKLLSWIADKSYPVKTMHGDLHTGNIIFNPINDQITLIDPRGSFGKCIGTHGDGLYDWAKLAHDLYFGYYSLINGNTRGSSVIRYYFVKTLEKYNLPIEEIIEGGALLLATAIPLHYDNKERQKRFREAVEDYITGKEIGLDWKEITGNRSR